MLPSPKTKRVVLLGGGHAHAVFLRMWAMHPYSGTEICLVSPFGETAYSGMLPAAVAGLLPIDDMLIDLRRLAKAAGAVFIDDLAEGLDLNQRRIILKERPPLSFDILSINLGSLPRMDNVPGALLHAQGVKPVDKFLSHWEQFRSEAHAASKIALVGGGAGGVELALAMRAEGRLPSSVEISLLQSGPVLLPQFNRKTRKSLEDELLKKKIKVHLGEPVQRVEAGRLILAAGKELSFDVSYWATDATPPPWFRDSGLALDEKGFALTDDRLLCSDQDGIFAVGDCASIEGQKRPKSGVFAVRLGRPLFKNIRALLDGQPLKSIRIQKKALALIGTGDGRAVATRGRLSFVGSSMWRLKTAIDYRFMRRFVELPLPPKAMASVGSSRGRLQKRFKQLLALKAILARVGSSRGRLKTAIDQLPPAPRAMFGQTQKNDPLSSMRCAGCGAKVGAHVLSEVLAEISREFPRVVAESEERLLWGLPAREDVTLWRSSAQQQILQSIDYFPALLDDPFRTGQIAANHAFSDILVKGAQPHSALLLAIIPWAAEHLVASQLHQLLAGVATQLELLGASLAGGHTAEGDKLAIGLTVTGISEGRILRKDGAKTGDLLILSKAIGTGVIFAAEMRGLARSSTVDAAVQSMLLSQHSLLPLLQDPRVHAATDITGFGLLGHLLEMLRPQRLQAELAMPQIPLIEGSYALARQGVRSSLFEANSRFQSQVIGAVADQSLWALLGDPQTSGAFLLSVAEEAAKKLLQSIRERGFREAAIIGRIGERVESSSALIAIKDEL